MLIMPRSRFIFVLPLLLLFAGCDSSPTEPGGGLGALPEEQVETDLFVFLNQARQEHALGSLGLDKAAQEVARGHSRSMRDQGFFGHVAPDGSTVEDRLRAAGVRFSMAAENVARVDNGFAPAAEAHQRLMNSPSHRHNILSGDFQLVGVGTARSGSTYWFTQIFIRP